jgi:hypothetical protein
MQAWRIEIATDIQFKDNKLTVIHFAKKPLIPQLWIEIPNDETLPADIQEWKKLSYLLAGLITHRFLISPLDDNAILVYLWHYSPLHKNFEKLEKTYQQRYTDMNINSGEFQNLVLQDTLALANKLDSYVRQSVTAEICKRNNTLVHIQYQYGSNFGTESWWEGRVNKYSTTKQEKPYNVHLYKGLECYRKMLKYYGLHNASIRYRLVDKHNQPVEEAKMVEEWADKYYQDLGGGKAQ